MSVINRLHILTYLLITMQLGVSHANNTTTYPLLKKLWGTPEVNRIYAGLFITHFRSIENKEDNWNGKLIGLVYKGFFFNTFVNSHFVRTYNLGVQRSWTKYTYQHFTFNGGLRIGAMYGYGDYSFGESDKKRWLFGALPYFDIQYKKVGVELQYFFVAATASLYFNF